MKGHLTLAMTSLVLLALSTTVLSLKLPGQGKESEKNRGKDGTWLAGRAAPAIPMWSFLPRNHQQDQTGPEVHGDHGSSSVHGGSSSRTSAASASDTSRDSDEILRAEDLAFLLSSKARLLNNSKRSLSFSSTAGDSSRKTEDVKRSRPYDVPLIECPLADDGMERFSCPTPDAVGRYRCVDDHVLCDGFIDCPNAEDEDRQACMFYKTTKAHLDVLADALLRWARGRR